jgi:hypothetical protein
MGLPFKVVTYKPGRYQLADGRWEAGQLYYEPGRHLSVRQPDTKVKTEYLPGDVTRFVIDADTFGVAHDLDITRHRRLAKIFGQQLYRTPLHTLYYYQVPEGSTNFTGNCTVVQPATGAAVRVPQSRGAFTDAMLPLFGACPEAAEGIRKGKFGPQHVRKLMTLYAEWARATNATAPASNQ